MNLSSIIPGVLLGFFVATVFATTYMSMGYDFGVSVSIDNSSFSFSNSLNAAQQIENKTASKGIDNQNTFFPALGTLFDVWNIIKSSVQDMTQTFENLFGLVGGDSRLVLLKTILVACLLLGITWIILAALFRMGSWKIN